jgi:hypothetical protein
MPEEPATKEKAWAYAVLRSGSFSPGGFPAFCLSRPDFVGGLRFSGAASRVA